MNVPVAGAASSPPNASGAPLSTVTVTGTPVGQPPAQAAVT